MLSYSFSLFSYCFSICMQVFILKPYVGVVRTGFSVMDGVDQLIKMRIPNTQYLLMFLCSEHGKRFYSGKLGQNRLQLVYGNFFQQGRPVMIHTYRLCIQTPLIIHDKQRKSALVNTVKETHEIPIALRCHRSPLRTTKVSSKMSNVFLAQCKQLFFSRWNRCHYPANASAKF